MKVRAWLSASRLAPGFAAAAVLLVAACSPEPVPPDAAGVMGVDSEIGSILLRATHAMAPEGGRYPPGSDATVVLTMINESDSADALMAVSAPDAERIEIRWDRQCDGTSEVSVARPFDPYHLRLVALRRTILAGTTVPLVFVFENAGRPEAAAYVRPAKAPLPEPSRGCSGRRPAATGGRMISDVLQQAPTQERKCPVQQS
jgi:copper(I)-binding protein